MKLLSLTHTENSRTRQTRFQFPLSSLSPAGLSSLMIRDRKTASPCTRREGEAPISAPPPPVRQQLRRRPPLYIAEQGNSIPLLSPQRPPRYLPPSSLSPFPLLSLPRGLFLLHFPFLPFLPPILPLSFRHRKASCLPREGTRKGRDSWSPFTLHKLNIGKMDSTAASSYISSLHCNNKQ